MHPVRCRLWHGEGLHDSRYARALFRLYLEASSFGLMLGSRGIWTSGR